MVVDHGRILAEMKVMFSSVVSHGYLSDERLKGMRSVDKEKTKIYMRVCSNPRTECKCAGRYFEVSVTNLSLVHVFA